jgi:hypothetical protein
MTTEIKKICVYLFPTNRDAGNKMKDELLFAVTERS